MDKRNSKESMLEHIEYLTDKIEKVFSIGICGIEYVGIANYHEREMEAKRKLRSAYYDDVYDEA